MSASTIDTAGAGETRTGPHSRGKLFDPLAMALLATAISVVRAGRPSFWYDEAATISAATDRSLPQLGRLLSHQDAVQGLYYLLMHGWFTIFPATEFWSRVPSALAVGAAAAGVVVFTRLFTENAGPPWPGRGTAVSAGVLFALLPRMTWAGIEARSYALMAATAVWLTVVFVIAVRRNRPWLWLLYALTLMVTILLNVPTALMITVYATTLPMLARGKSVFVWWAAASTAALGLMAPLFFCAYHQGGQITEWIAHRRQNFFLEVIVLQYFGGAGPSSEHIFRVDRSVPFALLAGTLIVAAAVARRAGVVKPNDSIRQLVLLCLAWITLPTGLYLAYSELIEPIYWPRHLIFTAPPVAVILAVCIVMIGRKPWLITGVLALCAIAAFPNYFFTQRGPYGKEGWDYSQVADVIGAHTKPGDCLLLDGDVWYRSLLVRARPAAFRSLVDVDRGARAPDIGTFGDNRVPIEQRISQINQCTTVWTITDDDTQLPQHQRGQSLPPGQFASTPAYQIPATLGFHIVERWQFSYIQVVKSQRQ